MMICSISSRGEDPPRRSGGNMVEPFIFLFRAGLSIGILKFDGNVSRRAYFDSKNPGLLSNFP
jgi:hypothetical protein